MLIGNPRKRRARKARKGRSAAQRAATARMLAANRSRRGGSSLRRNPSKRRRARRAVAVAAAPRRAARRASPRRSRRSGRRSSRSLFRGLSGRAAGPVAMLKAGAIGGAGAVANDLLFGFAGKVLPAGWMTPVNADGSTNWMYFAAKAGVAVALGTYGGKVLPGSVAAKMADGALTVLSYQILRGMVPSGLTLGYYNPVPTMQPRRLGAYVSANRPQLSGMNGMGAYVGSQTPASQRAMGSNTARMLQGMGGR